MKRKLLCAAGLTAAFMIAGAGPAFAHVTTDPDSAPRGGEITLGFRVPNEEPNANTTTVEIDIPTDHPLLGIDVEALPGWSAKVGQVDLNPPVQTDDGPVTQAVNQIVWTAASAGGIAPGGFQEFFVLVQTLPKDTSEVAFKAVQTYSDGKVVRWIDPITTAQPSPDHPTPILKLTPTASGAATVDTSRLAKSSAVSSAKTFGVIGIIVGALGLIVAVIAIATPRRTLPG